MSDVHKYVLYMGWGGVGVQILKYDSTASNDLGHIVNIYTWDVFKIIMLHSPPHPYVLSTVRSLSMESTTVSPLVLSVSGQSKGTKTTKYLI